MVIYWIPSSVSDVINVYVSRKKIILQLLFPLQCLQYTAILSRNKRVFNCNFPLYFYWLQHFPVTLNNDNLYVETFSVWLLIASWNKGTESGIQIPTQRQELMKRPTGRRKSHD